MIIDVEQGSPEWFQQRIGCCTASRVNDAIRKLKNGKYSAERERYCLEVVMERLTNLTAPHYVTEAMEWGIEQEPVARAAYEHITDCMVDEGQYAMHDRIKWFGASSDGLVGDDGCLEIKCPTSMTHLQWIIDGCVPDEHIYQMKAAMSCYNRKWCDFVSFDPRMPKELRLFIRRLERDEPMILEMEQEVEKFLAEVDVLMDVVKKRQCIIREMTEALHT